MVAKDGEDVIKLGPGGVKTIVAALRLFQKTYKHGDDEAVSEDFPDIFTAEHLRFGVVVEPAPLRSGDIEALCAQLGDMDTLVLKTA